MIHADEFSYFILELIKYADEEDIKLFLENCFSTDLEKDIEDDYRAIMLQMTLKELQKLIGKIAYIRKLHPKKFKATQTKAIKQLKKLKRQMVINSQ